MSYKVELSNFGPIVDHACNLGDRLILNLESNHERTFLLKAAYSSLYSLADYNLGQNNKNITEIISYKLLSTFGQNKLSDIVRKGKKTALLKVVSEENKVLTYSIGSRTEKQAKVIDCDFTTPIVRPVFVPNLDILSLYQEIISSRDKLGFFDDIYYDIALTLYMCRNNKNKNQEHLSNVSEVIKELIGGVIKFDNSSNEFMFFTKRGKFDVSLAPSNIQQIGALDLLLRNGFITKGSVIFIDSILRRFEWESFHELKIIFEMLRDKGVQIVSS